MTHKCLHTAANHPANTDANCRYDNYGSVELKPSLNGERMGIGSFEISGIRIDLTASSFKSKNHLTQK